ncbi:uncharacterized protein RAG0_13680 [Rhynchosporium agropyri]|uniref:CCHC-type domain-containing protein n=1 Tax=Rhynchosporium agropyri TaxID=914238 RepID=A0A1E1LDR9_9HELO|nr:uncharacterized protein RAG0_13680 [Rhynchosporium agropyri]
MAYVSQMMLMRLKAAEDGIDVKVIHLDYRDALLRLQQGENASTTSFTAQQYVAEHQTWDLNWPEAAFPGFDPRDPTTLAAPHLLQALEPAQSSQQEKSNHQPSNNPVIYLPNSSHASVKSSFPELRLGQRNLNRKGRRSRAAARTEVARAQQKLLRCHNCGGEHQARDCPKDHTLQYNDPMQLDQQLSSTPTAKTQMHSSIDQAITTTIKPPNGQFQLSSLDIVGVQTLRAILQNCEAKRTSGQLAEQKKHTVLPIYTSSKPLISPILHRIQIGARAPTPVPVHNDAFERGRVPNNIGNWNAETAAIWLDEHRTKTVINQASIPSPKNLRKESHELCTKTIPNKNHPRILSSSHEVLAPSSLQIPTSATMAPVSNTLHQHQEFENPPSPVRKPLPRSTNQKPSRPPNITQMIYPPTTPPASPVAGCTNCKRSGHQWKECKEPCTLCDRARHTAGECTFRLL